MRFDARGLSKEEQLSLYDQLLLPRMIEEKMMSQLRQGKISKWFSGMGQEAISVGVAAAPLVAVRAALWTTPLEATLGVEVT